MALPDVSSSSVGPTVATLSTPISRLLDLEKNLLTQGSSMMTRGYW